MRSWHITGGTNLPVTATVRVAGAVRAMIMRTSKQIYGTYRLPDCLHGFESRNGTHRHAFWLPEDRDGDHLLDHISIFAPGGLCDRAQNLLAAAKHLRVDRAGSFILVPVPPVGGLYGPCRAWLPATPFIGPRHGWKKSPDKPKARRLAIDQLGFELARLKAADGQPLPATDIFPFGGNGLPQTSAFSLGARRGQVPRDAARGWLAIEFAEPVIGPLVLGAAAHFGMGQFRPFHFGAKPWVNR